MAGKKVAICAVAQHKNESDLWYKRFQGMLLDVLEDLQAQTGFTLMKIPASIPLSVAPTISSTPGRFPTTASPMSWEAITGPRKKWRRKG